MRGTGIILAAVLVFVVSGCGAGGLVGGKADTELQKTFFDRTIVYTLDADAQEHMGRTEKILMAARNTEEPLPDQDLLPLYRDADTNRDHHISAKEAKVFYHEYMLRFEDSLGRTRLRRSTSTPPQPDSQ